MAGEVTAKKVKRSDFATFLNVGTGTSESWKRMGKGITSQKISYNPQTETEQYIDEESGTTFVDSYAPTMDGSQTAYAGDPVFDYVDGLRQRRVVGAESETDVLLVYIYDNEGTEYAAEKQRVSIQIDEFGGDASGANVIGYTLNFIGKAKRGVATVSTISGDTTVSFSESE